MVGKTNKTISKQTFNELARKLKGDMFISVKEDSISIDLDTVVLKLNKGKY